MEMSQEQVDQVQGEIPEWKRQALVVTDKEASADKAGLLNKLGQGVKSKIIQTQSAKQFLESEDYKKLAAMRAEMSEFKNSLKEEIDST